MNHWDQVTAWLISSDHDSDQSELRSRPIRVKMMTNQGYDSDQSELWPRPFKFMHNSCIRSISDFDQSKSDTDQSVQLCETNLSRRMMCWWKWCRLLLQECEFERGFHFIIEFNWDELFTTHYTGWSFISLKHSQLVKVRSWLKLFDDIAVDLVNSLLVSPLYD